jgi:hypothetical protein
MQIYIRRGLRGGVRGSSRWLIIGFKQGKELRRELYQLERLLLVACCKRDIERVLRRHDWILTFNGSSFFSHVKIAARNRRRGDATEARSRFRNEECCLPQALKHERQKSIILGMVQLYLDKEYYYTNSDTDLTGPSCLGPSFTMNKCSIWRSANSNQQTPLPFRAIITPPPLDLGKKTRCFRNSYSIFVLNIPHTCHIIIGWRKRIESNSW